jgi:hypothetical protein
MGSHGCGYKAWSTDCRKIRGEWNLNGAQTLDLLHCSIVRVTVIASALENNK